MKLLVYGVNIDTVSVENEEKYLLTEKEKRKQLQYLEQLPGIAEVFIFTNSVRTEYYFMVEAAVFKHGDFISYLAQESDRGIEEVILDTYSMFNSHALEHIFNLQSGIHTFKHSSEEMIESYENALKLSEEVLGKKQRLLKGAIYQISDFISKMKQSEDLSGLFNAIPDDTVRKIRHYLDTFKDKRILIYGEPEEVMFYGKIFYRSGFNHISMITKYYEDTEKITDELNNWALYLTPENQAKAFFAVDVSKPDFHLAASDSILLLEEPGALLLNSPPYTYEALSSPTKRKPIIVDFTNSEYIRNTCDIHYYSKNDILTHLELSENKREEGLESFNDALRKELVKFEDVY